MRLLEFNDNHGGANPRPAVLPKKSAAKTARKSTAPKRARAGKKQPGQVFPINGSHAIKQPVRRSPIDLEQLQQRIEVLERRMRERANQGTKLPVKDLEQLKQRMKLLERSVHNELWAAKQREHTLLEMLARPPLKTALSKRLQRFVGQTLPRTGRWFKSSGQGWWQDNQPLWWPRLAGAWQESLRRAREY